MPAGDLKRILSEFRRVSASNLVETGKTGVGICYTPLLALQLIAYRDAHPDSNEIPKDIIPKLDFFENELLKDTAVLKMMIDERLDNLELLELEDTVYRLYSKSKIQNEISKFNIETYRDEIIFTGSSDNIKITLSREEVVALRYIEHLRKYPDDEFDDDTVNYFKKSRALKELINKKNLQHILNIKLEISKNQSIDMIEKKILNGKLILKQLVKVKKSLFNINNAANNFAIDDVNSLSEYFDNVKLIKYLDNHSHLKETISQEIIAAILQANEGVKNKLNEFDGSLPEKDTETLRNILEKHPDKLKILGIEDVVNKLYNKSKIQNEISKLNADPNYRNEIIFIGKGYKDNQIKLSREELMALRYLEHLKKHPDDKFNDTTINYFRDSTVLEQLINKENLNYILTMKFKASQEYKANKLEVDMLTRNIVLVELNSIKNHLSKFDTDMKDFKNDDSYDNWLKKSLSGMKLIEYINTHAHLSGCIDHKLSQAISQIENDLQLKKIIRNFDANELKKMDIINPAKLLLADDEIYIDKLMEEFEQIILSEDYGNEVDEYDLTKREILFLRLMRILEIDEKKGSKLANSLTTQQKIFLNDFLNDAIGNMELNKKLRIISKDKKLIEEIVDKERFDINQSIGSLLKFSYKTRKINQYNEVSSRFIHSINMSAKQKWNGEWPKQHKITLAEYGMLSDIHSLSNPLPKAVYKEDPILNSLFENANKIKPVLDSMQQSFQSQLQSIKGHGLIALRDDKKRTAIKGEEMSWYSKLKYIVSNKFHASILYRQNPKGALTESHLVNRENSTGIGQSSFDFKAYMYSDLYRIDLTKLINKENKGKLFRLYGENWQNEISSKYLAIQRKIHDDAITSSKFGRIELANIIKRGFFSIFKHKKFTKTDFKAVHQKMISDFYSTKTKDSGKAEMICSEFVARCVISGLVQLNIELQKEYKKETKLEQKTDLVRIPIGKHENLKYITPERLATILRDQNCLEKIDVSRHIRNIVLDR